MGGYTNHKHVAFVAMMKRLFLIQTNCPDYIYSFIYKTENRCPEQGASRCDQIYIWCCSRKFVCRAMFLLKAAVSMGANEALCQMSLRGLTKTLPRIMTPRWQLGRVAPVNHFCSNVRLWMRPLFHDFYLKQTNKKETPLSPTLTMTSSSWR